MRWWGQVGYTANIRELLRIAFVFILRDILTSCQAWVSSCCFLTSTFGRCYSGFGKQQPSKKARSYIDTNLVKCDLIAVVSICISIVVVQHKTALHYLFINAPPSNRHAYLRFTSKWRLYSKSFSIAILIADKRVNWMLFFKIPWFAHFRWLFVQESTIVISTAR